jgi:hypothetical protein
MAFQAQDRVLSNGKLTSALPQSLSKFVNLSAVTSYDRELGNTNREPGPGSLVDWEGYTGQEEAPVGVFSRSMVREDIEGGSINTETSACGAAH